MQGTVLTFHPETNNGLISGHDGNRYNFVRSDWASPNIRPRNGLVVDFEITEKSACQIIVLESQSNINKGGKSKMVAFLLALLLGGIGMHKFYLGRPGLGILYLVFCWTLIPALIALIEAIILIMMKDEEFDRRYNQ